MRPVITAVFQNLNITMNFQVSIHRPVMSHYSSDPALGGSWAPVISATDKNLNIKVNYSKCPCANQRWAITQVTQHWMVHQHLSSRQSFRTLILRWIIQGVHAQPVMSHYSNDPSLGGSWISVIMATYNNMSITVNVLLVSFSFGVFNLSLNFLCIVEALYNWLRILSG